MSEVNYQEAVQALQQRIGNRYDATESSGRDEMMRVLTRELGYSAQQANGTLDAMISTGRLRYVMFRTDPTDTAGVPDGSGPIVAGAGSTGQAGAPTIAGYAGAPATEPIEGTGYWEIGSDLSEDAGRKGQIDPTMS